MSAREFSLQIKQEWRDKQDDIAELVARVGLECLSRVIAKSPVDTGRFKGNWFTTTGGVTAETRPGADQTASLAQGLPVLNAYDGRLPAIYIQNNLPYAVRLEDGWSKQAPAGMVALTVAEVSQMFDGDEV